MLPLTPLQPGKYTLKVVINEIVTTTATFLIR